MTVNPLSNVDPNQWATILEGAVQSREKTAGHHFYIINEGGALKAGSLKKGETQEKLSINNIVDISKAQFGVLSDSFAKGLITRERFDSLSGKISNLTDQLIDSRIAKRNQPLKTFGRQVAYAISAFASVFGISAFKSLKESDKAFHDEVRANKTGLAESKQLAEDLVNRRTKIDQLNQEIPGIIEQSLAVAPKNDVEKLLTKKIKDDITGSEVHLKDMSYTMQFKKDMERDFQFKRKDDTQNINDQTPYPNIQPGENDNVDTVLAQRVHAGVAGIKALIITEEDKRWEKIIQSACTQSTMNTIFDAPLFLFPVAAAQQLWEEEGRNFKAALKLPDQFPPIELEIIRNPDTQAIQKVNVVVKGSASIVRESLDNEGRDVETSVETANALKGEFRYSITLDENNEPVIEATHYELSQ